MTFAAATEIDPSDEADDIPPVSAAVRNALWWHCGWALAVALGAVGVCLGAPWTNWTPGLALIVGALPAVAALFTLQRESGWARMGLLIAWAAAAALAADLTGGLAGPLAAWSLTPLAAAILLGGRSLSWGAVLSLLALASMALAQAAGLTPPAPTGALETALTLVGLGTSVVGVAAAAVMGRPVLPAADANILELDEQPDLVVILGPTGLVKSAHGALQGDLGRRLVGRELALAAAPAAREGLQRALDLARADGRASLRFPLVGGDQAWLDLDLARASDGRLIGVLRDATADQGREEALDEARANAESLNIGKSRFLANMSHELRTPLNAIMGFSDIMRERIFGAMPDKYGEYADLIHDAGAHLLDLINDVLDMSKIEAAKYDLALERLDAREPVSAALRLMRLQADDAGVQLRGLLPNADIEVEADRRALKQIVLNLVSNALKFTPRGGLVTVSLMSLGGSLELSVADTGVGIAEGDLARLGRPYEQAGDAGQQSKGTGLGLSLVRAFAELHGGEMSIESRLGEGTAVNVRLPVLVDAPAAPVLPAERPFEPPAPSGGAEVIAFKPQR